MMDIWWSYRLPDSMMNRRIHTSSPFCLLLTHLWSPASAALRPIIPLLCLPLPPPPHWTILSSLLLLSLIIIFIIINIRNMVIIIATIINIPTITMALVVVTESTTTSTISFNIIRRKGKADGEKEQNGEKGMKKQVQEEQQQRWRPVKGVEVCVNFFVYSLSFLYPLLSWWMIILQSSRRSFHKPDSFKFHRCSLHVSLPGWERIRVLSWVVIHTQRSLLSLYWAHYMY